MLPFGILVMVCLTLLVCVPVGLQAEPIEDQLESARAEYAKVIAGARKSLTSAMEAEVVRTAEKGDLDATLAAKKELESFQESAKLPTNTRTKSAVTTYKNAREKGRKKLIEAHKLAIAAYTKALELEKAQEIKSQLQKLESGAEPGQLGGSNTDDGMPAGAQEMPTVRQFLEAKRAAEATAAEYRKKIVDALDQRLNAIKPNSPDAAARTEVLKEARANLDADGKLPDIPDLQPLIRQMKSAVETSAKMAEKAVERSMAIAKSKKSEDVVAWLEWQRFNVSGTCDWAAAKKHIKYEHIEPTFSRAGFAPYIDEPPTRLFDAEMKVRTGLVGWQGVKPNLVRFTFDREMQPRVIRLRFVGSEEDGEVNVPKSVVVYDSADPKMRHKLGEVSTEEKHSTWLEVPLTTRSRNFVVDIQQTPVWTLLAEVEFR